LESIIPLILDFKTFHILYTNVYIGIFLKVYKAIQTKNEGYIIARLKYLIPRIIIIIIVSVIGTGVILIPFSIISSCIVAPPIDWAKMWGGTNQEMMHEMVVDSSREIYIGGEMWNYSKSSNDIFILKINESYAYNVTWGDLNHEEFSGMVLDTNDNIFIAGSSTGYLPGAKDVFILKYSNNLTLEWFKLWGGSGIDSCTAIVVDSLDNIYITGMTNYPYTDIFLLKFDNSGIIQWNRTWNTGFYNISEEPLSVVIDSTDRIFLGVATNITKSEWFLLKYDSSGNLLLNTSYDKYVPLEQLVLDSSNNLYAVGSYNDTYLSKFDNNGSLEWNFICIQDILRGTESLAIDQSDNIYIAGNELINASAILYGYNMIDYDTYLMKFNTTGVLQWNYTISHDNNLYLEILAFDPSGNIYLGGSLELIAPGSLSTAVRVIDPSGKNIRGEGGGCNYGDGIVKGIYADSPNNFIVARNTPCYNKENYDISLTKYSAYDFSHCPPIPNPWLLIALHLGLSTVFIIIGISYLIIKEKKRIF